MRGIFAWKVFPLTRFFVFILQFDIYFAQSVRSVFPNFSPRRSGKRILARSWYPGTYLFRLSSATIYLCARGVFNESPCVAIMPVKLIPKLIVLYFLYNPLIWVALFFYGRSFGSGGGAAFFGSWRSLGLARVLEF